jgi:hypothetical protein
MQTLQQRAAWQAARTGPAVPAAAARRAGRRAAVAVRAAGSTYGNAFRVTTFGESHGKGVGCVVDGVPPRLAITTEEIQLELDRRRPGQSIITTPRKEEDTCEILSGVFDGVTLGTPIAVVVRNKDQRSGDYSEMSVAYRPSHADATYDFKYGIRAVAGGGRSSARETIGRVAAGAIAKKLLQVVGGTEVRRRRRRLGRLRGSCGGVQEPACPAAGCPGCDQLVRRQPTPNAPASQHPPTPNPKGPGLRQQSPRHRLRRRRGRLHDGRRGEQHRAVPRPGGGGQDDRRWVPVWGERLAVWVDGKAASLTTVLVSASPPPSPPPLTSTRTLTPPQPHPPLLYSHQRGPQPRRLVRRRGHLRRAPLPQGPGRARL